MWLQRSAHLHEFNDRLTRIAGVTRISTVLSMMEHHPPSFGRLLRVIADCASV